MRVSSHRKRDHPILQGERCQRAVKKARHLSLKVTILLGLRYAEYTCIISAMIYGYARVSTGGQSVAAQVEQLTQAGAEKVFREKVSGATPNRAQLQRVLDGLEKGNVLLVTRLDRLARSTRD
jgi:Resolvase, N terminal domain